MGDGIGALSRQVLSIMTAAGSLRQKLSAAQQQTKKVGAKVSAIGRGSRSAKEAVACINMAANRLNEAAGAAEALLGSCDEYLLALSGGGSAAHGGGSVSPGSEAPAGWPSGTNDMKAVHMADGVKSVRLTIAGESLTVPCTKEALGEAYSRAVDAHDTGMAERIYAMHEIETFRESLELTSGYDPVQLGGYHGNVSRQDPSGYESHHIPSRGVVDDAADWLPAVSLTEGDHKLTSSYGGRQRTVYESVIPGGPEPMSYKDEMKAVISKGSSGFVQALCSETLDLRLATGHRYDGGVSAMLDAAIDHIAEKGIPDARE